MSATSRREARKALEPTPAPAKRERQCRGSHVHLFNIDPAKVVPGVPCRTTVRCPGCRRLVPAFANLNARSATVIGHPERTAS